MKKKSIVLTLSLVMFLFGCKNNNRTTGKKPSSDKTITTKDKITTKSDTSGHIVENKTLYVANNGLKDNDGLTKEKPTTLENALLNMDSGDTIYLISGTYEFDANITIQNSGSEVKRNTLECENGVVIDFSSTKDNSNNGGLVLNGSYWEINNLNVINSDYYGFVITGRGNKLYNCSTSNNYSGGFSINSSLSTFTNCTSTNNSLIGYFAYGFFIYGSGDNNLFDSCISTDNQDSGFYVSSSKKVTFNKCLAINNGLLGDSASSQRSGFVFNNKGHEFNSCIAYNNALNGFLVPTAYAEKGSYSLINCSSINNHSKNYYLKTNNDTILLDNILSFNNYDGNDDGVIDASNDYIIASVKNSIMFYSKGYYYEKENPNYNSNDISKIPLDLSGYTNGYIINLEVPEEMKEYIDLDAKAQIDEEAIAHGTTPDYSSLEYNIIYFKDGHIYLYDYLDRSILFQDELFENQGITEITYFGSDINKIGE